MTPQSQSRGCPAQDESGRVPKQEEIEQVTMLARVMYKAVLGLHYERKEQKKDGAARDLLIPRYVDRLR